MDIKGTVFDILPLRSGVSQSGKEWKSIDVIIDTGVKYK